MEHSGVKYYLNNNDIMADVTPNAIAQRRKETDTQRLIRLIMDSPLKHGKIYNVDGETPLKDFKNANTDLKTRMFMQIGLEAASGDIKAAEFMMKHGGLTPEREESITINIPRFANNIPNPFEGEEPDNVEVKVVRDPDHGKEDEY